MSVYSAMDMQRLVDSYVAAGYSEKEAIAKTAKLLFIDFAEVAAAVTTFG